MHSPSRDPKAQKARPCSFPLAPRSTCRGLRTHGHFDKLGNMLKAAYVLSGVSGVATVAAPVDWEGPVLRVAQYVFDAYFIAFIDAVSFGTLCI